MTATDTPSGSPGDPPNCVEAPHVVSCTSNERIVNNTMRHQYRVLSDTEKAKMAQIKDTGLVLYTLIESVKPPDYSREIRNALDRVEEAVMWAVKEITK